MTPRRSESTVQGHVGLRHEGGHRGGDHHPGHGLHNQVRSMITTLLPGQAGQAGGADIGRADLY